MLIAANGKRLPFSIVATEEQPSFGEHVIPPAPIANRLRIMASANTFEAFVLSRLDKTLGLDKSSAGYEPALQCLATVVIRNE